MKLSENFNINEIFGNQPYTDAQAQTAMRMAITILQPIRDKLNHPIKISSGYRSPAHNAKIGGSKTSEHTWQGYAGAVDVSIFDHSERVNIMQWLMDDFNYTIGQCIYYLETTHLHISIANTKQSEFMVCTSKKNHSYTVIDSTRSLFELDTRLQNAS